MIPPGLLHVGAALIALATGLLLFRARKGTARHRRLGYLYLGAMLQLNIAAWAVETGGVIGPFHFLTLVSLVTLIGAYAVIVTGPRGRPRSEAHGIMMAWSYAGAVSAALGQAAASLEGPVALVIAGSLAVAGAIIHGVRPSALRLAPSD